MPWPDDGQTRSLNCQSFGVSKLEIPLIAYHELLDRSAVRHGDRDAIRFEGDTLSFKELQQKSHQMAQVLRTLGGCDQHAGPE